MDSLFHLAFNKAIMKALVERGNDRRRDRDRGVCLSFVLEYGENVEDPA
jgi:hypothetical protein